MGAMFSGEQQVQCFQAIICRKAIQLYVRAGILPNRNITIGKLMLTAGNVTGQKFKARDYSGAIDALTQWIEERQG